jgi:hypothetical protein
MLKRLLAEPFLHFLVLALSIFGVWEMVSDPAGTERGTILVTAGKIEQLAMVFAKVRQRPPGPEELKGLIDDYVKEEILVREAIALGLDEDDTVIRRRLRYKMEFLSAAETDSVDPTEAELEACLAANREKFEIAQKVALQQVFVHPGLHEGRSSEVTESLRNLLRSDPAVDPATLGDATTLPREMPLGPASAIAQVYGEEFAGEVVKLESGVWHGPVRSGFGLHLVRITAREPGRAPKLDEAREAVTLEWKNARRVEADRRRSAELLDRYRVVIESAAQPSP